MLGFTIQQSAFDNLLCKISLNAHLPKHLPISRPSGTIPSVSVHRTAEAAASMYRYVLIRLLAMAPTILGAGIIVFFVMRIIPGDVCLAKWVDFGQDLDPALLELCRDNLGLNDPLDIQFVDFLGRILTLDLGVSLWNGETVAVEIGPRAALSLQLAVMSTVISVLLAVPLGIVCALRRNSWIDYCIRLFSIAGVAVPSFWLGTLIILGLLILTQSWTGTPWMPPIVYVSPFVDLLANLSQLIWPAIAVGYRYCSITLRMTRSAILDVLQEDYVRTARAKGLTEKAIVTRHALGNAFLPVLTLIGSEFAFLMGGLVVVEQVFNLNGLGALLLQSVENQDFPVIEVLVMLIVGVFVLVNFTVDLLYTWLDPRIRYN